MRMEIPTNDPTAQFVAVPTTMISRDDIYIISYGFDPLALGVSPTHSFY